MASRFKDGIVQVRPHYHREGGLLFFMISSRPTLELSPDEVELFEAIDGRTSVSELARRFPGTAEKLERWHTREIIELVPVISAPARPHLVVIEPHMDDAALSVAGRLLHRQGRSRITILSVVKRSNYTSYFHLKRDYFDVDRITKLRIEESRLAAALLGAEHSCLDWEDAPLRFRGADRWCQKTLDKFHAAAGAYADTSPLPRDVNALAAALVRKCEQLKPDELWIPMGLGSHIDHRATRSACMKVAAELQNFNPDLELSAYQDLPYGAVEHATYSAEAHATAICSAFDRYGTRFILQSEGINDVFDQKIRVISVFASQFKGSVMEPKIRQCARQPGSDVLSESYYKIEGSLQLPKESELAPDSSSFATIRDRVSALLRQRETIARLAIILLPSSHLGKWDDDQRTLLAAFPRARFHIYLPEDAAWEAEGDSNERISTTVVPGGLSGLLSVIGRECYQLGTPTIFLWWGANAGGSAWKQRLLTVTLPLRKSLFFRTLGDFCALITEESVGL